MRATPPDSHPVPSRPSLSPWWVVIPVKGTRAAKSRFGGPEPQRLSLAHAMAIDTVEAALAAAGVEGVVVVTGSPSAAEFADLGAVVVADPGGGLDAAVVRGLEALELAVAGGLGRSEPALGLALPRRLEEAQELGRPPRSVAVLRPTAVLLGDLPALAPVELAAALASASSVPRGVVADYLGTGTTLLTARAGELHVPSFGAGSLARHVQAGYEELPISRESGLRRDVDSLAELTALPAGALGPRTSRLVAMR